MWGHTFKPVSFWYRHRPDGSLRTIVVEVNNTLASGTATCSIPRYGAEMQATQVFHVSLFCAVRGDHRFRFLRTHSAGQERTVVRIDHGDEDGPLLQTSVSGVLEPVTPLTLRRALWATPP